jgi:hypothetical protein
LGQYDFELFWNIRELCVSIMRLGLRREIKRGLTFGQNFEEAMQAEQSCEKSTKTAPANFATRTRYALPVPPRRLT